MLNLSIPYNYDDLKSAPVDQMDSLHKDSLIRYITESMNGNLHDLYLDYIDGNDWVFDSYTDTEQTLLMNMFKRWGQ